MKTIIKIAGIVTIILFASTSAFAFKGTLAKYDLENQLIPVSSIPNTSFIGWNSINDQSLILQTTPSDYYLIVLSSPALNLPYTEHIGITGLDMTIRPGFDSVIVHGPTHGFAQRYIISKIYKFKNSKQVRQIEAQLSGKTKS